MSREQTLPAPRLFLITPLVSEVARFAPLLDAAVGAADVACVLLRTRARDDSDAKALIRALAPIAQAKGAALLIEADARLATRADADGVHMSGAGAALTEALAALQPRLIVGCGDLAGRDDAMTAGEAGVDYLMFGSPDDADAESIVERVEWWASIFNVPCVGYAGSPALAGMIARAGAEFVALCDGLWDAPDIAATLAEVERTLQAIRMPT